MTQLSPDLLREACRRRGLPVTAQRKAIFETLRGREDHPTADQVYEAVRERLPGVSRATVYRVLSAFVEWGLADKLHAGLRGARFDGNRAPHHHLVCVRCDRVTDWDEPVRVSPPRRAKGFRVERASVVFEGTCSTCSRKET